MSNSRLLAGLGLCLLLALPLAGGERVSQVEAHAGLPVPGMADESWVWVEQPLSAGRMEAPHSDRVQEVQREEDLSYAPDPGWAIETVDGPRTLEGIGDRGLALDAEGHPHIAYGGTDLSYAWHDGTSWHSEVVDSESHGSKSLALDSSGRPHISYHGDGLEYAYHDGSAWHVETVDAGAGEGSTSVALDAEGHPHISFIGSRGLEYAYNDGSGWITATVDHAWGGPSLALDGTGHPHLGYVGGAERDLRYGHFDGVSWITETVTESLGWFGGLSLALDDTGRPHLAYIATYRLYYAHREGPGWHIEIADGRPLPRSDPSLALDAAGRPHISNSFWNSLTYLTFDSGSWISTTLDWLTEETSLALGPDGRPHVAYCHLLTWPNGLHDAVKYAWFDGISWQMEVADDRIAGWVGETVSLAVDEAGRAHVSYLEDNPIYSDGFLKYAYHDGATWSTARLDRSRYDWSYTSLALGSAGLPHIVYSGLDSSLIYAHLEGSIWVSQTIAQAATDASLALDAAGHPWVAYVAYEGGYGVKCAWYDGLTWQAETVDAGDADYGAISLAIAPSGHPHVSYRTSVGLEYAWRDSSVWHVETLDRERVLGGTSLAIGPDGWPQIAYAVEYQLRHASFDGAAWTISAVDSAWVLRGPSLALDPYGWPHIAYSPRWALLAYARYSGSGWLTETLGSGADVRDCSLELDRFGQPQLAYVGDGKLRYAHVEGCVPLDGIAVDGPASLPAGIDGLYSTSETPPSATVPIVAWDNGTVYPTATYSWPATGTHRLAVTATNACSVVGASFTVTVFCQPVEGVEITGPARQPAGIGARYVVTPVPITSSLPLTTSWDNGTVGSTAVYTWTEPGTYTLSVTAVNCGGQATGEFTVTVFCQPVEEVNISGPLATLVGQPTLYRASVQPITASLPMTFTWNNGTAAPAATYTWPATGTYTLTITATNACGQVRTSQQVSVLEEWPEFLYVPRQNKNYKQGAHMPVGRGRQSAGRERRWALRT